MKPIRVLIVDDSAVIRKIVERSLHQASITTEGSESRVVEALSAGARGYIRKPFTPDQVKERVTPLLEDAR